MLVHKLLYTPLRVNYFASCSNMFSFADSENFKKLKRNYDYLNKYQMKQYLIETEDKVKLHCFRIQKSGAKPEFDVTRKPVYMQHGLFDSSDTWICNNQNHSPGLILADKGYDVWIGNIRGNDYRTNQDMNFTFDQMAKYDIPALLEYINKQTKQPIHYVGHSQGTLVMFIALAETSQLNDQNKIQKYLSSFSALGPVVYLRNHQSILVKFLQDKINLRALADIQNEISNLNNFSPIKAFSDLMKNNLHISLSFASFVFPMMKKTIIQLFADKNSKVDDLNRIDYITLKSFPSDTSVKNAQHFRQFCNSGQFKKYDYGTKQKNISLYKNEKPPKYDLSKIKFPVHMFVGLNDRLATLKDAEQIDIDLVNAEKLPGQKRLRTYDQYGHATFIWGKDISYIKDLISVFEASEKKK